MQNQILESSAMPQVPFTQEQIEITRVFISPEMAALYLDTYKYHGQRNLRPYEVARYARLVALGRWRIGIISLCKLGDKTYLVDGQHRLSAIVMSGQGQEFFQLTKTCSDEWEVACYYNSIDSGINRNDNDQMRAFGVEQRLMVLTAHKYSYAAATKMLLTEFSHTPTKYLNYKDPLEKQIAMSDHLHAHALYRDAMKGAHAPMPKVSLWAGMVAVGIVTYEINQHMADIFWRDLAEDQPKFPPISWLQKQLVMLHNSRPSQVHVARLVTFAWNRWNKEPKVKIYKRHIQAVDEPIFIHGSDKYTGKQQLDPAQLSGRRGQ